MHGRHNATVTISPRLALDAGDGVIYGRLCNVLGELGGETPTRYIYGRRGGANAFVSKRSPAIHIEPCKACPPDLSPG
jgi:hypothetical protein